MANNLYTPTGIPDPNAFGRSSEPRNEFLLIQAGFNKLRHTQTVFFEDANASAESRRTVVPFACKLVKAYAVQDAANSGADTLLTISINEQAVTGGVITLPAAGTEGAIASCVPSALNTATAGQSVGVATDAGGTGALPVQIVLEFEYT